jgi:hypothetical protein
MKLFEKSQHDMDKVEVRAKNSRGENKSMI